jgi:glycogen synthase
MNILLATESYYPNIDGGAIAQYNLASELKKLGHTVNILAPGYQFKNYKEEINGVNVYRTRSITLPFI